MLLLLYRHQPRNRHHQLYLYTEPNPKTRPVNEPNEREQTHVRVRLVNFNRIRTPPYKRTHFCVCVRSLRKWACSCSFMHVHLKPKQVVHKHKRTLTNKHK
ncbi:hypothetical protein Hanom_Chr07g00593751 [Helianthus anomalus]